MVAKNRGLKEDARMYGRGGDTEVGHLTPGEIVIPTTITGDPTVKSVLRDRFAQKGMNVDRYTVGKNDNSINPVTGYTEFWSENSTGQASPSGSESNNFGESQSMSNEFGGLSDAAMSGNWGSYEAQQAAAAAQAAQQQAAVDAGLAGLYAALGIDPNAPALNRNAFDAEQAGLDAQAPRSGLLNDIKSFLSFPKDPQTLPLGDAYPSFFPGASVVKGASYLGGLLEDLYNYIDPAGNRTMAEEGNPFGENSYAGSLRGFMDNPTYSNIPAVDPTRAMKALQDALSGVSSYVGERGFTGYGYEQDATDELTRLFNSLTGNSDVESVLNKGVGTNLATTALANKEGAFRQQGLNAYNEAFPNDYFSSVFDPESFNAAIDDALASYYNVASQQGGNAAARGNLSSGGLAQFNTALGGQKEAAANRLKEIGSSVSTGYKTEAQKIADEARTKAQGYTLGDELFSVDPYKKQLSDYAESTKGKYGEDIRTAVGMEQLFDPTNALQTAGMSQGLVSGNSPLLDVIAGRENTRDTKRGLGRSGSGVF